MFVFVQNVIRLYGTWKRGKKMKEIKLTQGLVALVDDGDFEWLNRWKWYAQKNKKKYYASRNTWDKGKHNHISMHRLIVNVAPHEQVDHIDNDGLNNTRKNLRICNNSQNHANIEKNKGGGFKGV